MDEETENQESTPGIPLDDDSRFEVKWRKKETSRSVEAAPSETGDITDLNRRLEEAERRGTDLQDRWHRAAADLANLRKRTEAERAETDKLAGMMLVADLLPVLDNFERALTTIPGNLAMLTWIQGVMLIQRHMQAILEQRGVTAIDAQDQRFDPHLHEAIAEQETDAVAPGQVVRVLQAGYIMHGHVIRPALVEVAKAPPASEPPAESTDDAEAQSIADDSEVENTGP
ncbi:MAG: nucleotide exchange factor GrpE [Chloroflexota bacterium]